MDVEGLALPSRKDVKPVAGRAPFLADAPNAHPWQFAPQFSQVIDTANNELSAVYRGQEVDLRHAQEDRVDREQPLKK